MMAESNFPTPSEPQARGQSLPTRQDKNWDAVDAELQSWSRHLRLLVEVNSLVAEEADTEAAPGRILARIRETAHLAGASIYRLIPEERLLKCVAEDGCLILEENRTLSLDGPGLVPQAARTGEAAYGLDMTGESQSFQANPSVQSEYAVPLIVGSNVLGVLAIVSDQPDGIRAATRKLIDQVAHQVALALDRTSLSRELRASEERYRSIFEQGQIGIAVSDLEGVVVAANPALAQLLGYEPAELVGRSFADLIHHEDREANLEAAERLTDQEAPAFSAETRFLHKSGEVVWGMTTGSLIRDHAGKPLRILRLIHDITQRKRVEAEWARVRAQISHFQKFEAMGALAGGIVHDFNNLLGVIRGYVSLTRLRLHRDDPLQEPIGMIEQSAERAGELAHELLQFGRRETLKVKPLDLGEVLSHVLKIVSQTFDRRIRLETHLAEDLPWIEGESGQLELAILNICINARDAMPEGGTLTLETSVVTLASEDLPSSTSCVPGEYVRLTIRDTGVGMDPQSLQRIFEPFFTTKEAGRGSGLGLAMVQGIVSSHGGFVRAESRPGSGSEFVVFLPATKRREEPPAALPPATAERGAGTVLVVDDEPLMRAFAEDALKELGYQVLTAEDGDRACQIYAARFAQIDCVLLDMIMPGAGWRETLLKLRRINPKARIILSSGADRSGEARQALELGAEAFLGKPYAVEALASILKKKPSAGNEPPEGSGTAT